MSKYNERIYIPEFEPSFNLIGGLNNEPIDYRLLKRKPILKQNLVYDVWSSSGATGDATFRVVNIIGQTEERETTYNQEILTGLGNTTAKITRTGNINVINNAFTLQSGEVLDVFASFSTATQNLEIRFTGGSFRYIRGNNRTLTTTNNNFAVINSGNTDLVVDMRFATSAAELPIFGVYFQKN